MAALKALVKELQPRCNMSLHELIGELLHTVMAFEGHLAFSKSQLDQACHKVEQGEIPCQVAAFLDDHGVHIEEGASKSRVLTHQALQVVTMLSLRWYETGVERLLVPRDHDEEWLRGSESENPSDEVGPGMSDYQRRSWLAPAFSSLVGQVLWRHRHEESLQGKHEAAAENLLWICMGPQAGNATMEKVNAVFQAFTGSETGRMTLAHWRKLMDLVAANPDLRQKVRQCDAVRSCWGEATAHSHDGKLKRKQFKLMLAKTADLMNVHPLVLFQDVAAQVGVLRVQHLLHKDEEVDAAATSSTTGCSFRKAVVALQFISRSKSPRPTRAASK